MKVSKKTEYGLRAMVCIATLAGTSHPVPLPTVAVAEDIPEQFLDQIISKLRKTGFVRSVRGASGGYLLSRPANEIKIGSLVRVLEGSLAPIGCVSEEALFSPEGFCERSVGCQTRNVWLRVLKALTTALDSISLADVMKDGVPLAAIVEA